MTSAARSVGIGFEPHLRRQRHQDLARVVFLPEEPLVEHLPRPLAVAERRHDPGEEQEIDDRTAGEELLQRLPPERRAERRAGGDRHDRQRPAGQRVLDAAPQDHARPEHARDAHRIGQAERRQQHERLQERGQQPRVHRHPRAGQHRDDRHAVLHRVGEHAGNGRVDRHLDPAALVGVVDRLVAIDAFDDHRDVERQRGGERTVVGPGMAGVPRRQIARPVDADEIERRGTRRGRASAPAVTNGTRDQPADAARAAATATGSRGWRAR